MEQEALFEPFVQTQAGQKSQEGTGLGLPISRQFVQLMGGDLTVCSQPGQGATFSFTIPVELAQVVDIVPPSPLRKVMGLAVDEPSYRLLVVEDSLENRSFLVQLLQEVGFEVREAENGEEAIALWQQWAPHLIWMDMRMPVMNGYEATRHIRRLEAERAQGDDRTEVRSRESDTATDDATTKILALTASAFEDERTAILASGCDDFVLKPATETILFEKMAQHIGVRYLYQEPAEPFESAVERDMPDSQVAIATLQQMPPDWLAQLHRAARMADEELILKLLEQMPTIEARLEQMLKELVNELRLDKLIEITTSALTVLDD
jgi:CheY-like chemotaxis protein